MPQQITKILAQLAHHERRIAALEGTIKPSVEKKKVTATRSDYSGPTGGVRYLIGQDFFKEKCDLATVREKLGAEGYYYSRQAVHEALKTLSKSSGPLVGLKEGSRKTYVERK